METMKAKNTATKSPTPKSKGPVSSTAASKKTTTPRRKAVRAPKGIIAKASSAIAEAVSTLVGGAISGAAAAGTKLVEEKTGSIKKTVKGKSVQKKKAPVKKRSAASK